MLIIEVDVSHFIDRRLAPADVADEMVSDGRALAHTASVHGELIREVHTLVQDPRTVYIADQDDALDIAEAGWAEAVRVAAAGYEAIQEGGPNHGEKVQVSPRVLPRRSGAELFADHLAQVVIPSNALNEHLTALRVMEWGGRTEEQRKALEDYLRGRLLPPDLDALSGGAK